MLEHAILVVPLLKKEYVGVYPSVCPFIQLMFIWQILSTSRSIAIPQKWLCWTSPYYISVPCMVWGWCISFQQIDTICDNRCIRQFIGHNCHYPLIWLGLLLLWCRQHQSLYWPNAYSIVRMNMELVTASITYWDDNSIWHRKLRHYVNTKKTKDYLS